MLRVDKVDSLELPELAPYRTMRRQLEHREQGIFVAEGEKVVRRLLESALSKHGRARGDATAADSFFVKVPT